MLYLRDRNLINLIKYRKYFLTLYTEHIQGLVYDSHVILCIFRRRINHMDYIVCVSCLFKGTSEGINQIMRKLSYKSDGIRKKCLLFSSSSRLLVVVSRVAKSLFSARTSEPVSSVKQSGLTHICISDYCKYRN